jgi:hypothetical protein
VRLSIAALRVALLGGLIVVCARARARLDSNLTVIEAIKFIGETLNVACGGNIGLYLPGKKCMHESGRLDLLFV